MLKMKPLRNDHVYPSEQYNCPKCGTCVGAPEIRRVHNSFFGDWDNIDYDHPYRVNFCPSCGTEIDWSDDKRKGWWNE